MDPLWISQLADKVSGLIIDKASPSLVLFWNGIVGTATVVLSLARLFLIPSSPTKDPQDPIVYSHGVLLLAEYIFSLSLLSCVMVNSRRSWVRTCVIYCVVSAAMALAMHSVMIAFFSVRKQG